MGMVHAVVKKCELFENCQTVNPNTGSEMTGAHCKKRRFATESSYFWIVRALSGYGIFRTFSNISFNFHIIDEPSQTMPIDQFFYRLAPCRANYNALDLNDPTKVSNMIIRFLSIY
jgi:hypothetical protein